MERSEKERWEPGDRVRITSETSEHRGETATVIGYCKGKDPSFCRVRLDSGWPINVRETSLEPVREDSAPAETIKNTNIVTVRWFDSYLEEFEATEVRFGFDILFLRLADGKNRHIPLRQVRWFGMTKESHQREHGKKKG